MLKYNLLKNNEVHYQELLDKSKFETKVLICQSVLVGKVPEIYLNKGVV